jgi:hypothetical protein
VLASRVPATVHSNIRRALLPPSRVDGTPPYDTATDIRRVCYRYVCMCVCIYNTPHSYAVQWWIPLLTLYNHYTSDPSLSDCVEGPAPMGMLKVVQLLEIVFTYVIPVCWIIYLDRRVRQYQRNECGTVSLVGLNTVGAYCFCIFWVEGCEMVYEDIICELFTLWGAWRLIFWVYGVRFPIKLINPKRHKHVFSTKTQ